MKYPPEHIDALAAEYVLGTLHGRARQRFEALLQLRADARVAVWQWEQHLAGMAHGLTPRRPPRRVWRRVRQQIAPPRFVALKPFAWASALTASLAVFMLAAYLLFSPTSLPPDQLAADRLAVFTDAQTGALWVINTDLEQANYRAQAVAPPAPPANSVYELWVLPAMGNPHSMGLLTATTGSQTLALSDAALSAMPDAKALAISIEPLGGSPTGLPTGPVVYQAALVQL